MSQNLSYERQSTCWVPEIAEQLSKRSGVITLKELERLRKMMDDAGGFEPVVMRTPEQLVTQFNHNLRAWNEQEAGLDARMALLTAYAPKLPWWLRLWRWLSDRVRIWGVEAQGE
jgi:hypothetical protein